MLQELHAQGKLNAVQRQFMALKRPELEFYDLQADPHEVNNLAASPKHKTLVAEYDAKLTRWLQAMDDKGSVLESREVLEREEPRIDFKG